MGLDSRFYSSGCLVFQRGSRYVWLGSPHSRCPLSVFPGVDFSSSWSFRECFKMMIVDVDVLDLDPDMEVEDEDS